MSITMTGTTVGLSGADAAEVQESRTSEEEALLVRRAATGDRQAFGELVERYQRPMASLVSRLLENPEDVDDVLQEMFVRAWKGLPNFRGDAQFSTWLYRIAVNTALKYRTKRKGETGNNVSTEELVAELPQTDEREDPFVQAHRREQEQKVRLAVQKLPEKQRVVVLLHYFEGYSCEEISQMAGCSVGTVWSRLHYACKKLKGILSRNLE